MMEMLCLLPPLVVSWYGEAGTIERKSGSKIDTVTYRYYFDLKKKKEHIIFSPLKTHTIYLTLITLLALYCVLRYDQKDRDKKREREHEELL